MSAVGLGQIVDLGSPEASPHKGSKTTDLSRIQEALESMNAPDSLAGGLIWVIPPGEIAKIVQEGIFPRLLEIAEKAQQELARETDDAIRNDARLPLRQAMQELGLEKYLPQQDEPM